MYRILFLIAMWLVGFLIGRILFPRTSGTLIVTEYPDEKEKWTFEVTDDFEKIKKRRLIHLKIRKEKGSSE